MSTNWRPTVTKVPPPKRVPQVHVATSRHSLIYRDDGSVAFPLGIPVRPATGPEVDSSEASLRTVRCASDCLSRDTPLDVIRMQAAAELKLKVHDDHQLQWPHRLLNNKQSSTAQLEKASEIPVQKSSNNFLPSNQRSTQNQTTESDSHPRRDASERANSPPGNKPEGQMGAVESPGELDLSLLLQALVGHVYGSDCQRLGNARRVSVETDDQDAPELAIPTIANNKSLDWLQSQHIDDWSEMMTLTCGDVSQTLLTELYQRLQCPAGRANISPKTLPAEKLDNIKERTSAGLLKNAQSSLSLVGSELDQTLAATALLPAPSAMSQQMSAALVEAIPPSDRLGKKYDTNRDEDNDDEEDERQSETRNTAMTIGGSTNNNDVTMESKVVLDMGSCTNLDDEDTATAGQYCRSSIRTDNTSTKNRRSHQPKHRHQHKPSPSITCNGDNRRGQLRTPNLCIQPARYDLKDRRVENDDAASSFTAAMIEWDEQKRRAYNNRRRASKEKSVGYADSPANKTRDAAGSGRLHKKSSSDKKRNERKRSTSRRKRRQDY